MTYYDTVKAKRNEITKEWRKTEIGCLWGLYDRMHMSEKEKIERHRRVRRVGKFTLKEFYKWAYEKTNFKTTYLQYKMSGYVQSLRPSVDRINPLKGYLFSNMQIITQAQNLEKGRHEMNIVRGTRIHTKDGTKKQCFLSCADVQKILHIHSPNVLKCLTGERLHAGGYSWELCKCKKPNLSPR